MRNYGGTCVGTCRRPAPCIKAFGCSQYAFLAIRAFCGPLSRRVSCPQVVFVGYPSCGLTWPR